MVALVVARVITEPDRVEARLREMGLESGVITRAVQLGDAEAGNCTPNDPVTISGLVRWGRTVRSLRDDLIPRGWERCDDDGLAMVVHPKRKLAIAVARGDESTGIADEEPRTKYARGPASQSRVETNKQMMLFDSPRMVRQPQGMPTYFLLVHPGNDHVSYELVLPATCDEAGRFESYAERIIFPRLDTIPGPRSPVEDSFDVDVPVKRRG
jgi:hypothetical protein